MDFEYLRKCLAESGLNLSQVAELARVQKGHLAEAKKGGKGMSGEKWARVAAVINMSLDKFWAPTKDDTRRFVQSQGHLLSKD